MESSSSSLISLLSSLSLPFIHHKHPPSPTMAELQTNLKLETAPYIKNLFYVDKKDNYYLVLALSDTKVEKTFWKAAGVSPGNIRLARDEQIEKILGVPKGVVNPFALQNDKENKVPFLIFFRFYHVNQSIF